MTGIGPVAVRCPRVRDRRRRLRAHPLFVGDSASLRAAVEEPGGTDPDPLPQGHLDRRLRGRADRIAREGRQRALGLDYWTPEGGLVRRTRPLEQARSLGQTLYLLLGRRHSRAGPSRRHRAMPADHHRSHTRGQEGACRPHRRCARKCAILAGTAPRSETAWAVDWPRARGRQWRARILASGRTGMASDARPALLGAQNRQRPQQTAEEPATESQAGAARNTKKDALAAFDAFIETWGVKYDKAVECLIKDRDALLAFYDFPAEHWKHLRTTNVIESSFATVRHRTVRSKGCLSSKTALAMIFKLAEAAEKSWRRLNGHNQLPKIILGIKFTDGIEVVRSQAQVAAA